MAIFNPDKEEQLLIDRFIFLALTFIEDIDLSLIAHAPSSTVSGIQIIDFGKYRAEIRYTDRTLALYRLEGNKEDNYITVNIQKF